MLESFITSVVTFISYLPKSPKFSHEGLLVTDFDGNRCGGKSHKHPRSISFYANNKCTNHMISGNVFMHSMVVRVDEGYVYEYSEFNCTGSAMYVALPNDFNQIKRCLDYGHHSNFLTIVNNESKNQPTILPTLSPFSPSPVSPVTLPSLVPTLSPPRYHWLNRTFLNENEYQHSILSIASDLNGEIYIYIGFILYSYQGN